MQNSQNSKNHENPPSLPGLEPETPDLEWYWRTDYNTLGNPETGNNSSLSPNEIRDGLRICEPLARALAFRGMSRAGMAGLGERSPSGKILETLLRTSPEFRTSFQALAGRILEFCDPGTQNRNLPSQGRSFRLGIVTDFDTDGASSAAAFFLTARMLGWRPVRVTTPDRGREGHGPVREHFTRLSADGAEVFLVLDCGSSNGDLFASMQGQISVLGVVDHHDPGEMPEAQRLGWDSGNDSGNLNPNILPILLNPWVLDHPGHPLAGEARGLSAGALSVLLCREILSRKFPGGIPEAADRQLGILASLSTVCDVMELSPERKLNRALVREGLESCNLQGGKFVPKALREIEAATAPEAGPRSMYGETLAREWNTDSWGWRCGPVLNAGNRMGQSSLAVETLCGGTAAHPGGIGVPSLLKLNTLRKELSAQLKREGERIWGTMCDRAGKRVAPVLHLPSCPGGQAGLVAGHLAERSGEPSFVLAERSHTAEGIPFWAGSARGSRSLDGEELVNVGELVRRGTQQGILVGGGHAAAAGFRIADWDPEPALDWIRAGIQESLQEVRDDTLLLARCIDAELPHASCRPERLSEILLSSRRLEPWGNGFERPVFGIRNLMVANVRISRDLRHCFGTLQGGDGIRLPFKEFFAPMGSPLRTEGNSVDVCGRIELDPGWGKYRPPAPSLTVEGARMHLDPEEERKQLETGVQERNRNIHTLGEESSSESPALPKSSTNISTKRRKPNGNTAEESTPNLAETPSRASQNSHRFARGASAPKARPAEERRTGSL